MIIRGNTVGTTMPRANWNQTDTKKADYVIGKDAVDASIKKAQATADNHGNDKDNPHGVTAEQVGARPDNWMPTAEEVGARPDTWMPTADDVGARPDNWMPTAEEVKARPDTWMPSASDVGAVTLDLLWTNASPTSDFASQNITIPKNSYKGIFVDYVASTTASTYVGSGFIPVGDGWFASYYLKSDGTVFDRRCKLNTGTVGFGNGSQAGSDKNSVMIPTKIYGVK